jgi:3-oxoacyl-[acyl-carrier protein] reductase
MRPLAASTILITGATDGLGKALATALAGDGARVLVHGRDDRRGEQTLAEIREATGSERLAWYRADLASLGQVRALAWRVIDVEERLDVLVNNAGIVRDATLGKVSDDDWTATLDVNLRGTMIGTRAALRPMRAAGAGRILSATSVVARMGNYGQTAYAASKAGIIGMTRAWARELGPLGITANAVAPGFIDTEMARGVPEKVLGALLQRTAARRLGRPEEVAAVYVFLASDLASFINGAVVGVDGGLLL